MLALLVVVLLVLILVCVLDTRKPKGYPPGPKWWPIVGNYLQFRRRLTVLGYHHLVHEEFSRTYGPVVCFKMGRNIVVTVSGVEAIREVLTRDEFDGRPDGFFFRLRTFGKRLGIVFSDGKLWQRQRKFSLQHLKNFGFGKREMEAKIAEETRDLIEDLRKKSSDLVFMHNAFDVGVLNVLWTMMAGERFTLDDVRLIKLLQIVHDAFRLFDMSGGLLNQLPVLRFLAPGCCGYTKTVEILKRMWLFLEETIAEHRKTACSSHSRDLIDAFLREMQITSDSDSGFTDEQLLSLCLDLFMAGSETTSNTLGFAVLYMVKYPGVQKRVQEEMDEVVGRNRWPTMNDKINLPYTEAVLMETQRLANVPPLGVAHRATRTTNLFGYTVPEGAIVLTSLYSIHMDDAFWKDPKEFRPDRFLRDGKVTCPEWSFLPFGYGKRRCLGESLAKTNYFLFFTAMLHNFFLHKDPDTTEVVTDGCDGVTISPRPFRVRLASRYD
ncbi:hypothetical protein PPYR_14104 [Photinus pyralis]|uniref:Cytochrome P450 n=1 Tax=Photinus pyralis TaxID=7054 RepID=A0A5N4A492_PHOPY|nr:hypothetical protein PPYR_14104 [Photinus pyralis]